MAIGTVEWPRSREEQRTFVEMLSHDDRDSSYIVAWTDSGEWKQRAFKASAVDLSRIPKGESVYMTRNGFVGSKRDTEHCRQVNAIMFDIDCHTDSFKEDVPKVIQAIDSAVSDGAIPSPSMVVDTGRGVQVYFVLESSISYRVSGGALNDMGLAYYKDVEEALANSIRRVVEPLEGVQFDASVLDYSRVGRVPGTYNPKARRWCSIVSANHSFYTLKELKRYGTKSTLSHIKRAQKVRLRKKSGLLNARLVGIERLQAHRGFDCVGSRENMCFVYYNTATQIYGPDKALSITHEFNSRFSSPLPHADIEQISKTVDGNVVLYGAHRGERGFYPLRAATVIEKLFMTAQEMESTRFFGTKRQRDRAESKARTRAAREERNARIIRKFKMGMTQEAVAHDVGCSKRTVASVLKQEGVTRNSRFTLEEKFHQVIDARRENANSCHSSWLCAGDSRVFPPSSFLGGCLDVENFGGGSPPLFGEGLNERMRE